MAERDSMICRPDSNGGHVVTSADGRLEKIMFAKKPHLSNMDFHFGTEKCEMYITRLVCHGPCIKRLNGPLGDS